MRRVRWRHKALQREEKYLRAECILEEKFNFFDLFCHFTTFCSAAPAAMFTNKAIFSAFYIFWFCQHALGFILNKIRICDADNHQTFSRKKYITHNTQVICRTSGFKYEAKFLRQVVMSIHKRQYSYFSCCTWLLSYKSYHYVQRPCINYVIFIHIKERME